MLITRFLETEDAIARSPSIRAVPEGVTLADGYANGDLWFPAIAPGFREEWVGLELQSDRPDERGLAIAFNSGGVLMSGNTSRLVIQTWTAAIASQVRLSRQGDGYAPTLKGIKLGWRCPLDLNDYWLEFGLDKALGIPCEMGHWGVVESGAIACAPLDALPPERIASVRAMTGAASIAVAAVDGRYQVEGAIDGTEVFVRWTYRPPVQVADLRNQGIVQLDALPVIVVQPLPPIARSPRAIDHIRIGSGAHLQIEWLQLHDAPFEVQVVATQPGQARAITAALIRHLAPGRAIALEPFGLDLLVRQCGAPYTKLSAAIEGNLAAIAFEFTVRGLCAAQRESVIAAVNPIAIAANQGDANLAPNDPPESL